MAQKQHGGYKRPNLKGNTRPAKRQLPKPHTTVEASVVPVPIEITNSPEDTPTVQPQEAGEAREPDGVSSRGEFPTPGFRNKEKNEISMTSPTTSEAEEPEFRTERPKTKRAQLVGLLERSEGASIAEITTSLGWLPHTVRAALTGLRHRGRELSRHKDAEGKAVYRLRSSVAPPKEDQVV
jgi:hypothetical protein